MADSQQILPNEILQIILNHALPYVSLFRGASWRRVNRLFATSIDDFYFFHGHVHQTYKNCNSNSCPSVTTCVCRFYRHGWAYVCVHHTLRLSGFAVWQVERYWKGFLLRSLDTVPRCRHELRRTVYDGIDCYELAVRFSGVVVDGASPQDAVTKVPSTLTDDTCKAMVLLLGPDCAFNVAGPCQRGRQTCISHHLMRNILTESQPILVASIIAATRQQHDLVIYFLDLLNPASQLQSPWEYTINYRRFSPDALKYYTAVRTDLLQPDSQSTNQNAHHSPRPLIYVPKLRISDADKPLAQALAACLTIAIATSDLALFKALHDYDLQETSDGRFQHRLIGSLPFREIKFRGWRNVQETTLHCGESEMYGILVRECGWHWPWEVSKHTRGRMREKFGQWGRRGGDDSDGGGGEGDADVEERLRQTKWWCCRRLSGTV